MELDCFSPKDLPTVLRTLRTALEGEAPLQPQERMFLDTFSKIVGGRGLAADPQPLRPEDVRLEGAHQRKRLVQLSAMAVLLGRPMKPASIAFLKALARQLDAHDGVIEVIDALARGRRVAARLRAMRRAFRVMFKEAYGAEGPMGVLRFAGAMLLRLTVNKNKAWQYKRLGLLPEGTLGREYWKHMAMQGFGFPGERGGIPASVSYHDVAHVLTGHDTTAQGEIQQACFQGGNRREDGFFFIQFGILQFHQGLRLTPAGPPEVGHFDPERVLWAIHRGAKCRIDMTHQWDYWPLMPLPLQQARARCGLLPPLSGMRSAA